MKEIVLFYKIFDQFMDYLGESFKYYRSEIILAKNKVNVSKRKNPQEFISEYVRMFGPHYSDIKKLDAKFIIDKKVNHDLSSYLRDVWIAKSTTLRQQAMIFYYLEKLIVLGFSTIPK